MKPRRFILFLPFIISKVAAFYLSVILFVLLPATVPAQSPGTNQGMAWLLANQNSSGSWGAPNLTEFRDTTVVADVLKKLNETGTQYTNAISFIDNFSPGNNDYLARKTAVLAQEGYDISQLVNELLSSQNPKDSYVVNAPEGGWGAAQGYATNNLDTVLVLDGLSATGYDPNSLHSPIDYLVASQNEDGGWGLSKGSDSNIYLTSRVLITLAKYTAHFDLETAIANGIAGLKGQQKVSGAFGTGDGSIYETALAYIAMAHVDPSSSEARSALVYVANNQQTNGSWNNKANDTAVSLWALWTYLNGTDANGDGMADWWEMKYFGSLDRDGTGDWDGDGLIDLAEFAYLTDPTDQDSDGDGYGDGDEVGAGTNPIDPNSHPVKAMPWIPLLLLDD
jgi:hypothetical protein